MTTTVEVRLELPDALAKELARLGLLEPANLEEVLREAARSRFVERLVQARKRIAASGLAPLTMEEIKAEIAADRAARRSSH